MKLIIAGSRSFNDYNILKTKLDHITSRLNKSKITIISGTCYGADKLGEQYANENNLKLVQFPADWKTFGKSAGYKRNLQMGEYADAAIVFIVNDSKGSQHMIDIMNKLNKRVVTVKLKTK